MAVKVTQQRDQVPMTDNVKLISIILLCVSLFFSILFFTSFQLIFADANIGAVSEEDNSLLFVFLVTVTTLTISVIAMEFYHVKHRSLAMLKYATIVGNAVMIGLLINELTKGYDDLFGTVAGDDHPGIENVMYTYATLATGFAGVGTLLAVIHNFHGIMGLV